MDTWDNSLHLRDKCEPSADDHSLWVARTGNDTEVASYHRVKEAVVLYVRNGSRARQRWLPDKFHTGLCGRAPGSGVRDCHTSVAGHSYECRYVQLQSCRLADGVPNLKVALCAGLIDALQLFAHPHSIARRIRVVRNSETLDRCAYTVETLRILDGRSI